MNFKLTQLFYSLINIIVALFFVFVGVVCFLLPWFSTVRQTLISFIQNNSIMIFLFGFGFIIIGIAYITYVIYSARRRYYRVRGGPKAVTISETLFNDYLVNYWKQVFPTSEVPCSVKLESSQIHITADLPFVPLDEQKKLIEQMQQDVTEMFTRFLGYRTEYILSVSFNEEPTPKTPCPPPA